VALPAVRRQQDVAGVRRGEASISRFTHTAPALSPRPIAPRFPFLAAQFEFEDDAHKETLPNQGPEPLNAAALEEAGLDEPVGSFVGAGRSDRTNSHDSVGSLGSTTSASSLSSATGSMGGGGGGGGGSSSADKLFWMPDRLCKVCYDCEQPFNMIRRRHHCRMCGQVFCHSCSPFFVDGRSLGVSGTVRACKMCNDQVESSAAAALTNPHHRHPIKASFVGGLGGSVGGGTVGGVQGGSGLPTDAARLVGGASTGGRGAGSSSGGGSEVRRVLGGGLLPEVRPLGVKKDSSEPPPRVGPATLEESASDGAVLGEGVAEPGSGPAALVGLASLRELNTLQQDFDQAEAGGGGAEGRRPGGEDGVASAAPCGGGGGGGGGNEAEEGKGEKEGKEGNKDKDDALLKSNGANLTNRIASIGKGVAKGVEKGTSAVAKGVVTGVRGLGGSGGSGASGGPGGAGRPSGALAAFTPCRSFKGARPGLEFKTGPKGTGYYPTPAAVTAAQLRNPATTSVAAAPEARRLAEGEQPGGAHSPTRSSFFSSSVQPPHPSTGGGGGGGGPTSLGAGLLGRNSEAAEAQARHRSVLSRSADKHLERLVLSLVKAAPLLERPPLDATGSRAAMSGDAAHKWQQVIVALARRVVGSVDPDVRRGGDLLDIRAYVKCKTVPGGSMDECAFVDGVVFRKHVIHKRMVREIRAPRILLLAGGIEFQRSGAQRMASFDTLMEQERTYIQILVEKIVALRPDLVLVGQAVSRQAQEYLEQHEV